MISVQTPTTLKQAIMMCGGKWKKTCLSTMPSIIHSDRQFNNSIFVLVLFTQFVIITRFVASQQTCRGYPYDPKILKCCADYELCPLSKRISHKCCGKRCYSEGNSMCCNRRLVDKCSQFYAACCGYRCYKSDQQLCCDEAILPRCAPAAGCCGRSCIDLDRQICCQGRPVTRCAHGSNAKCCGDRCYDASTQTCSL
ncbi:hypothetical protein T03_10393 [Trichinella britovi]|uniref:Galaxin-like repeats domain-containing protein n=2 Tax=Trichinella TaxID=6333 RepID=A0A0V1DDG8_TRIBR|nr:hypothetical protein T03_10393 [Trichinella britovi]